LKHVWESLWNELPDDFPREDHAEYEINKLIANLTTGSVLDVGCAAGVTYDSMLENILFPTNLAYVGIDFTKRYLISAKEVNPYMPVVNASAFYLPFPNKSFDTVFCKSVLEHQHPDEYFEIVKEMIRVARYRVFIAWYKPPHLEEEVIELVEGLHSNRYNFTDFLNKLKQNERYVTMKIYPDVNPPEDTLYSIYLNK